MKKFQIIQFYKNIAFSKKTICYFSVFLLLLGINTSCKKTPRIIDMKNIRSIHLQIEQKYSDVDENIKLPLKEVLTEIFEKIGVQCVDHVDSCDANLSIFISGKPYKAVFEKPKAVFYESAYVKGRAKLKIKGFSIKIIDLFGKRHYFSSTYQPYSNTDPQVPLLFANKKAFIKMVYDLWGLESFLKVWDIKIFPPWDEKFSEISDDGTAILPEIFHVLENDTTEIRYKAILLLDELTESDKINNSSNRDRAESIRSSEILNRNTNVRKEIGKKIDRLNKIIKNDFEKNRPGLGEFLNILSRLDNEASSSLPLLNEMLKIDKPNLKPRILITIEKIKSSE